MKQPSFYQQVLKKWPIGRFLRFGIVGFSGLFVDLAVFYLLREQLNLNWRLCTAISIEMAIINNFFWNDAWTFADLAQKQKGWGARLQRLMKFNAVCLIGAFLQYSLMELFLRLPGIENLPQLAAQVFTAPWTDNADEYFAKIAAIAIVTFWNFWLNLKLSWRSKP